MFGVFFVVSDLFAALIMPAYMVCFRVLRSAFCVFLRGYIGFRRSVGV